MCLMAVYRVGIRADPGVYTVRIQLLSMTEIEIRYCRPCRAGGQAAGTRRALLSRLRDHPSVDPDEVTLSPASEEVFCVAVDGERVWSAADPAGRVDPVAAVNAVRRRLGQA